MATYMLLFLGSDERWESQPKADMAKAYETIGKWWREHSEKGVITGGEELAPRRTAMTVRRVNGQMRVTDGPFIESKEHVGGYAVIEAPDLDAAIAIAKSWPGGDVEVRPVVAH